MSATHQRVLGMYKKIPPGEILKSTLVVLPFGTLLFGVRQYFNGNEDFHRNVVMPIAHRLMDAESAHRAAINLCKYNLVPWHGANYEEYDSLQSKVFGRTFVNPIGLAAGFDKDAEVVGRLQDMGFGFVEAGTVTPRPQPGNDKPRVFRLTEDKAVINRYGFNSAGAGTFIQNMEKQSLKPDHPVLFGINLGMNKTEKNPPGTYAFGMRNFCLRCDYLVINVSSPNTPGLRDLLSSRKDLEAILSSVLDERRRAYLTEKRSPPPILLKLSPDLSDKELKMIAEICQNQRTAVDGVIIGNTTVERADTLKSELKTEQGGLSGVPLAEKSTKCISNFYKLTKGAVPIVGCGGVSSGQEAYRKLRAGASLVQLYTVIAFEGFPALGRIKRELNQCLVQDGFTNVSQVIGKDA